MSDDRSRSVPDRPLRARRVALSRAGRDRARVLGTLALLLTGSCGGEETGAPPPVAADLGSLARCLTARGAVYYAAAGCSACRAQERQLGAAFEHVVRVECHPHAPGSEAERCVGRGIRVTPTWVLEPDGLEIRRLEGARTPEALAAFAGCDSGDAR